MIASSELCWDIFSHFYDASKNSWEVKELSCIQCVPNFNMENI